PYSYFFIFHDPPPTKTYTLSLHDALPIYGAAAGPKFDQSQQRWRAHRLPHRGHPQPEQFAEHLAHLGRGREIALASQRIARNVIDRKSTRLNSSHLVISYAVFCLKKKKKK